MLIACLDVEVIQRRFDFAFADPVSLHQDQVIETIMSMYICHAYVYCHAKFGLSSLNIVRDMAIITNTS